MHRSLFHQLRRHLRSVHIVKTTPKGIERFCNELVTKSSPCSTVFFNSIHTSQRVDAEDDTPKDDVKPKSKKGKRNTQSPTSEERLQSAAVDAAKSLPGNWNRTADELLARLAVHGPEDSKEAQSSGTSSLLSSMSLERSFEIKPSRYSSEQDGVDTAVERKRRARKTYARKFDREITSLYSERRLGIFDAKKVAAEVLAQKDSSQDIDDKDNLWHVVSKEKLDAAKGSLPRNGFEEMIQWTQKGHVYTFPVDNEEDMHEERQYGFHEHVFLNQHMGDFPTEGPLRRFMDLVVIGLSKNPWVSVPEKIEHVRWYADYFHQKQALLETSIGEKAKMKQIE